MIKYFYYLFVSFLCFQNINIISAPRTLLHKEGTITSAKNHNEKKPKSTKKHISPFKQTDEILGDNTKSIGEQKKLIDKLHASINYLKNIYQIICCKAQEYWNKNDGNFIASELAVLCGDIKTTITFINNCICFLSININGIASLSAEDMADWIEKINEHVLDLNQKNILQIKTEDLYSKKIRKSAKKLQDLLL